MKTVRILETFDGYPNGTDEERFVAGETPTLSDDFADLIVGKGLAKEIGAAARTGLSHLDTEPEHDA